MGGFISGLGSAVTQALPGVLTNLTAPNPAAMAQAQTPCPADNFPGPDQRRIHSNYDSAAPTMISTVANCFSASFHSVVPVERLNNFLPTRQPRNQRPDFGCS
jgi:hypothetical protein